MIGDTFKETAVLRSDGVFYNFGVIPKLRSLYGVKPDEPIYEVEFEVVEEKVDYPNEYSNDIVYFAYKNKDHIGNDRYSLIQPTAEMFAMQFPWDIWKHQGELKGTDILGNKLYFGVAVRIKPKSYTQINEENENKKIEFEIPTWLYGIIYLLECACIGTIIGVCIGLFINYLL